MDSESKRRQFLGALAAGTVSLTAGCTDALNEIRSAETESDDGSPGDGSSDSDRDVPNIDGGAVVFVYDDGPMSDYELAFPVHQEFDIPASTGIVTEWMDREDFNGGDWMGESELTELADAGWEIMAHTTGHNALGEFELVEDVDPGDTRIYPEERNHGFHQIYDLEITDGKNSVRRAITASSTDETGPYIEFEEAIGESFAAGETVERYPEDLMNQFLGDCKEQLEAMDFVVDTLLAPYDIVDEWALEFATDHYDGIANVNPGSMLNPKDEFDPFDTNRNYFIEYTSTENTKAQLANVEQQEAIAIIGAHTFKEDVTESKLRDVLEWVDESDLEPVTFRDAIRATADGSK
ncbi:polysaccharide deacetylase [Halostagnicola sp. A56]|uniref:polysaccharide deacetylase family protein n=1 Tax=Halostagnicola sp. A56 TaxID=1495067 RepID=UPI00049EE264|nr:polysaccharide deacetylase family protein [Halostagnicola sp. A56]KDE58022.1 polysaccharide deacetylase [Halostagnicola sp. A56]